MPDTRPKVSNAVLITGVSGLIGTSLAKALAKAGYQVVGMDIGTPDEDLGLADFFETDLTDDESVRNSLEAVKKSTGGHLVSVVHLAAYYDFSGEPSPLYKSLTVDGTRRMIQGLHEMKFLVDQFIFSSTLLVMHPDESGGSISEFSQTEAEWAYPMSKLETEHLLKEHRGGIPLVVLRIAGVYDDKCHSLPISQQIVRIYERQMESYVFPGDQTHGQAFVHLRDLVDCIRRTIDRRNSLAKEELFLIAEPEVMSYQELQNDIGQLIHGTDWTTVRIPKAVARAGAWIIDKFSNSEGKPFIKPWMVDLADDHYEPNIAHARSQLGWEPRERLRETLPRMVAFLQEHPDEFYTINKLGEPSHK